MHDLLIRGLFVYNNSRASVRIRSLGGGYGTTGIEWVLWHVTADLIHFCWREGVGYPT